MSCSTMSRDTFPVRKHQEIHSGHFMVSNLDDSETEADEPEVFGLDDGNKTGSNNFSSEQSCVQGNNLLAFEELGSLFQYLAIAYTSKLTSPKWNRFRGLRFALKSKIRLNNIIWREYHMQFIKCVKPAFVQFQKPLTENHQKPEAIVMEGKYWKRSVSIVRSEYRLWRKFTKDRLTGCRHLPTSSGADTLMITSSGYNFPKTVDDLQNTCVPEDAVDSNFGPFLNDIMMELDDDFDLFFEKSINYSFLGIGDIMQPGLLQFQPDTIDEPMPSMQLSSPGNGHSTQNRRASPYITSGEPPEFSRSPYRQIVLSEPSPVCAFSNLPSASFPTPVTQALVTTLPSSADFPSLTDPCFQPPFDDRLSQTTLVSDVPPSEPTHFNESSLTPVVDGLMDPAVQGNWGLDPVLEFQKPVCQPPFSGTRRVGVGKRHRRVSSQTGRYKAHVSSITPPIEKALKSVFSSDVHQSTVDCNLKTSVLPSLSQNKTQLSHQLPWFQFSTTAEATKDTSSSYCSAPLLCSALTTPLSVQSILTQDEVNQNTTPFPKTELSKPRPCASEPHRLQSSASLLADSKKSSQSVDVIDTELITGSTQGESFGSPLTSRRPAPRAKHSELASILKSAPITSQQTSFPEVAPLHDVVQGPSATRHRAVFGLATDSPKGSLTKVCTFVDTEMSSHHLTLNASKHRDTSFSSVLQPQVGSPEQVSSTQLMTVINKPLSDPIRSSEVTHTLGPVPLPLTQVPDSNYSVFSTGNTMARRRTSSGNFVQGREVQEGCSFSSDRSWDDKMSFHLGRSKDVHYWQQSSAAAPTNLESTVSHAKVAIEARTLPNYEISQFDDANVFTKGRCSSTGNLFPVSQAMLPQVNLQDSTTTVSSYGSIEVLTPPLPSQPTLYTPPSCSPPPQTDMDPTGRSFLHLSSEEQRRHAVQSRLQALQHLIHFYNLDYPNSRRRHDDYDPAVRVPVHGRMESTSSRNPINHVGDSSVLMRFSAVDTTSDTKFDESLWPANSESTGRSSNAATLRQSAELIRYLREVNETWEAKRTALQNEMSALEALNAACLEKRFPSGKCAVGQLSESRMTIQSKDWFRHYVHQKTEANWKFYTFSLLLEELFHSFNAVVNTLSPDHFVRSIHNWIDQHCSPGQLHPAFWRAMCRLATTTSILSDPGQLPEQSRKAAAEQLSLGADHPLCQHPGLERTSD